MARGVKASGGQAVPLGERTIISVDHARDAGRQIEYELAKWAATFKYRRP